MPPIFVGFEDRHYRYKSVASQIIHDSVLTQIDPVIDSNRDCQKLGNEIALNIFLYPEKYRA
jgi:hypothetical protein